MNIYGNRFFITLLVGTLSACVVPGYNPDLYNGYKVIQSYQKKDTIGHTDPVQRKKDVFSCGVKNYMDGNLDLSVSYPGMTTDQVIARRIRIDDCIESKGYIYYGPSGCTNKGKPTGLCN